MTLKLGLADLAGLNLDTRTAAERRRDDCLADTFAGFTRTLGGGDVALGLARAKAWAGLVRTPSLDLERSAWRYLATCRQILENLWCASDQEWPPHEHEPVRFGRAEIRALIGLAKRRQVHQVDGGAHDQA